MTRSAILVVLPVSAVCGLSGLSAWTRLVPVAATRGLQLWRLATALLDQGQFFTLLFVLLLLATQMPAHEIRQGSLAFLAHLASTGLLVNCLYAALAMLLALAGAPIFAAFPAQGLWPTLLATTTAGLLADPAGSSSFLCLTLPNRV